MDSSSSSSSSSKVEVVLKHAVVIPHPLQGHITPALHLSHHLSHHHIFITFLLPQHLLSRIPHPPNPNLRIVGVSDSLPAQHPRNQTFLHGYELAMAMEASVEELLSSLTHVEEQEQEEKQRLVHGGTSCFCCCLQLMEEDEEEERHWNWMQAISYGPGFGSNRTERLCHGLTVYSVPKRTNGLVWFGF